MVLNGFTHVNGDGLGYLGFLCVASSAGWLRLRVQVQPQQFLAHEYFLASAYITFANAWLATASHTANKEQGRCCRTTLKRFTRQGSDKGHPSQSSETNPTLKMIASEEDFL
jgi:hypothetical protein